MALKLDRPCQKRRKKWSVSVGVSIVGTFPCSDVIGSIGKDIVINVCIPHALKEKTVVEKEGQGYHDDETDGQSVKDGVVGQGLEKAHHYRLLWW